MSSDVNLLDRLCSELGGDRLARLTSSVGEPEARVRAAMGGVVLAFVAVLTSKAATPQGRSEILDLMQTSGFDGRGSYRVSSLPAGARSLIDLVTRGGPLVLALFGARKAGIVDWLAASSGTGARSSSALLALAVPSALDLLAREARQRGGLTPSVLGDLLSGPGAFVRDAPPEGLVSALGCTDQAMSRPIPRAVTVHASTPMRSTWWRWVVRRRHRPPRRADAG